MDSGLLIARLVFGSLMAVQAALSLALTGPGSYSMDPVLGLGRGWTTQLTSVVLIAGTAVGFVSSRMRRGAATVSPA